MTTTAQEGYPEINHLLVRIEKKTDRQRHLLLAYLAGNDPHQMLAALKRQDELDATQEGLRLNGLSF